MRQFIPTPTVSQFEFGPITIHLYALCILLGIAACLALSSFLYSRDGGNSEDIFDVALFAIPFGILGGRAYHVLTSPQAYFGEQGRPLDAFRIWEGGMGIWGAIALGAAAAFITFSKKHRSLSFGRFADSIAPGLLLAQAIGRWGNWFNAELFGRASHLPWALEIPLQSRPIGFERVATYHPTFLYESIWCLIAMSALLLGRQFLKTLPAGTTFTAYIALYCIGRLAIESLRIDQANLIFGLRVNIWVSAIGACVASSLFLRRALSSR